MLWLFLKSFCAGTMPIVNGNEALNAMIMPCYTRRGIFYYAGNNEIK